MEEISLSELKSLIEKGLVKNEQLFDARRPDEYKTARIKGAQNIPHDSVKSHLKQLQTLEKIYFYCATGRRCKLACESLEKEGIDPSKLVHVMGNAEDWDKVGLPVEKGSGSRFSIQRQVYLFASLVILIGIFFSLVSSLWYLILPTFVGIGMLFSSIKGVCYSEILLSKMPWNR